MFAKHEVTDAGIVIRFDYTHGGLTTRDSKPDRARFAWSHVALPNLINREGLPAGAFITHLPTDK